MPKKIDPAVRERVLRMAADHRGEYATPTALAKVIAARERIGVETVRRWIVQAEIDAGDRPGVSSQESAEIKALKGEGAPAGGRQCDLEGGNGFLRLNAIVSAACPGFARFFAASALRCWLVVRCAAPARCPPAHGQVA